MDHDKLSNSYKEIVIIIPKTRPATTWDHYDDMTHLDWKVLKLFYNYQATVEEMYRGEFEVGSTKFTLDIEDTSGTFAWDFPAMVEVFNFFY